MAELAGLTAFLFFHRSHRMGEAEQQAVGMICPHARGCDHTLIIARNEVQLPKEINICAPTGLLSSSAHNPFEENFEQFNEAPKSIYLPSLSRHKIHTN